MPKPPSLLMKEAFQKLTEEPTPEFIEGLARKCLLPPSEVSFWIEHLQQVQKNRRRGAAKAAITRQNRKQTQNMETSEDLTSEAVFCGVCGDLYEQLTDEVENWVGCD